MYSDMPVQILMVNKMYQEKNEQEKFLRQLIFFSLQSDSCHQGNISESVRPALQAVVQLLHSKEVSPQKRKETNRTKVKSTLSHNGDRGKTC